MRVLVLALSAAVVNAGLAVSADSDQAAQGANVLLGFGIGPLRISVPCRVVYTVDEPDRRGFAYGTLPGHPESGEELPGPPPPRR